MNKRKAKEILDALSMQHPNAKCELNYSTEFELLTAIILSAQCTDARVNKVTSNLFINYNTPQAFVELGEEKLGQLIYSCGFYKAKAKHLIEMSKSLIENYGGEVPKDFDELTKLAGVGRKTASVLFCVAYNLPAMPVDTHVFRVSRRLGLACGNNVEKVEMELKKLFPPEMWNTVHHNLIFHGRYVCHARKPNCEICNCKELCNQYKKEGSKNV